MVSTHLIKLISLLVILISLSLYFLFINNKLSFDSHTINMNSDDKERNNYKHDNSNEFYDALFESISASKYDLFQDFKFNKNDSNYDEINHSLPSMKNIESINAANYKQNDILFDVVHSKIPTLLTETSLKSWGWNKLDLWDFSTIWTVLQLVLAGISNQTYLITEDERDNHDAMLGVGEQIKVLSKTEAITYDFNLLGQVESSPTSSDGNSHLALLYPQMLFADFLFLIRNPNAKLYHIADFNIMKSSLYKYAEKNNIKSLIDNMNIRDFFIIEKAVINRGLNLNASDAQWWIMHPGTAIRARYSPHHIIKCQLQGYSKMILIPPSKVENLHLYPYIHTSFGQSQLNSHNCLQKNIKNKFPLYEKLCKILNKGMTLIAEIHQNEIIYIPPFWGVIFIPTTKISVGLDIPSPSEEEIILLEAEMIPLPFPKELLEKLEDSKDNVKLLRQYRLIASTIWLVHVISRIEDIDTPFNIANNLYENRYKTLYPPDSLYLKKRSSLLHCGLKGSNNDDLENTINMLNIDLVQHTADKVAKLVNSVLPAIKNIWINNYIELIARFATGNPDRTVLFLKQCLDINKKLPIDGGAKEGPNIIPMEDSHFDTKEL